ncbi:hypothetical protein [Kordia sp.]|uniref:hypothetical protein n=1 Tax=Kordia sp. TaxID=1965332 RepID=UPI003D2E4FCB
MKKKNLNGLALKKYCVSNLSLLHKKRGGNINTDTETGLATTGPTNSTPSMYTECTAINGSNISDCMTTKAGDCECNTNTGTSKAQPPSEHQTCAVSNHFSH